MIRKKNRNNKIIKKIELKKNCTYWQLEISFLEYLTIIILYKQIHNLFHLTMNRNLYIFPIF